VVRHTARWHFLRSSICICSLIRAAEIGDGIAVNLMADTASRAARTICSSAISFTGSRTDACIPWMRRGPRDTTRAGEPRAPRLFCSLAAADDR